MGFTPYWDYKPTNTIHADSSGVYTCDKIFKLGTKDKIHLKCDVFDGYIQNGLRHPILTGFVLDKKPGYKVFSELETVHYKKIKNFVLNTKPFYLQDEKIEENNFNGKTLTFILQTIKT